MSLTQIRVAGFGGQGVIMAGTILGKAGAIFDNQHACMSRSYGPEARGGSCSAQLLISDEPITYPYVTHLDYLLAMSKASEEKYYRDLAGDGVLIYESDLVEPHSNETVKRVGIPCTRMAEELGGRMMLNMVMLGCLSKQCTSISKEAIQKAIAETVPPKTVDKNLEAFEQGYHYEN